MLNGNMTVYKATQDKLLPVGYTEGSTKKYLKIVDRKAFGLSLAEGFDAGYIEPTGEMIAVVENIDYSTVSSETLLYVTVKE